MTIASPNLYAVCDEYGLPRSTPFPSGFYGRPGMPSSGPFSLQQCVGLSNVVFTPNGGDVVVEGNGNQVASISCNQDAVWTYSGGGENTVVSVASGGSAPSISFTVIADPVVNRTRVWTVGGTASGVTRDFTVTVTANAG